MSEQQGEDVVPTRLYAAAKRGDLEAVREILKHATAEEINHWDSQTSQCTALNIAICSDHFAVVEEILFHPDVNPNLPNKHSALPLMLAFTPEMVHLLLVQPKIKANVEGMERSFRIACKEGALDLVRVYLAHSDVNINAPNENGVTALMLAVSYNWTMVVEVLLEQPNIDVNLSTTDGHTALIRACCGEEAFPHMVKLLLTHPQLKVNLRNETGSTALMYACMQNSTQAVAYLLKHPDIDVNLPDSDGQTPLLQAVQYGHHEICVQLLNCANIDANVQSRLGNTAIIRAAQLGHVDIVRALIKYAHMQPILVDNEYTWTTLSPTVHYNNTSTVNSILRGHTINPNLRNKAGWTALNLACNIFHVEIVRLLLALPGIDVNAENENGNTPLTAACIEGSQGIVRMLLLQPSIDVNKGPCPPLLAACASGDYVEVVKLLLLHPNIDVNLKSEQGWTALLLACHFGYTGIVHTMLSMSDQFQVDEVEALGCAANEAIKDLIRAYNSRQVHK